MVKAGGCIIAGLLLGCPLALRAGAGQSSAGAVPEFTVLASGALVTQISLELPQPELTDTVIGHEMYHTLRIPSAGWSLEPGQPELPVMARLIAIPPQASVDIHVESTEYSTLSEIRLAPCQDVPPADRRRGEVLLDQSFYNRDVFLPEQIVELGAPAILRDVRVAPLILHPVQYNPRKREVRILKSMTLTVACQAGLGQGEQLAPGRGRSAAFEELYRSLLLNYHQLTFHGELERGGYLIITPDQYLEALQPLAEWKQQKGHPTEIVPLSHIDPNPSNHDIRMYITTYYHSTSPAPEYVILVGDVYQLPTFFYEDEMETGRGWDAADHPYSLLEGDDYFPEVLVGRLSVASDNQLRTVVNKIISYERDPYLGQTDWYRRALMVCNYEGNASSRTTKIWVRDKLLQKGFTSVPTSYTLSNFECNVGFISTVINSGASFVNYRGILDWGGWTSPESYYNINNLQNGFMLPVVTDMVCRAAAFYDDCPAEAWLRAGSVINPKGAIAAMGPSAINTKVYFNNVLDGGFYAGAFDDSLTAVGQAFARAKMELYMQYPLNRGPGHAWNSVECYFYMYTLIGDPGLDMWTAVPQALAVEYPASIATGTRFIACTVRDSQQQAVGEAYVTLTRGNDLQSGGFTDQQGDIDLPVTVGAGQTITITATKPNFRPFQAAMTGKLDAANLVVAGQAIDDDASGGSSGDGDGTMNPGETVELNVSLRNAGTSKTAPLVTAALSSDDPQVTIHTGTVSFGDISPGGIVQGQEPYRLTAAPACPEGHLLKLMLRITDGYNKEWTELLELDVEAPHLILHGLEVHDEGQSSPNGRLDPGEQIELHVTLANQGRKTAASAWAVLRTADPAITLIDSSASLGMLPATGELVLCSDGFALSAGLAAFNGYTPSLRLVITSNAVMTEELECDLPVGLASSADPSGPDAYGYYAYDNTDWRYYDKPTYDWIEIDPSYGGSGIVVYLNDIANPGDPQGWIDYPQGDTRVIPLPFAFRYYGRDYQHVSICSNGWLVPGSTWMTDFRNWSIPAVLSPPGIIAPFWDDLYMGSGRAVYFHDGPQHRFIVEWSRVANDYNDAPETFQVILHDPAYYPTVSGDSEILFQYQAIDNSDYAWNFATVGIEAPDKRSGLEYTYSGQYSAGAAQLCPGLALKFTTGKLLGGDPYLNYYGLLLDDDGLGESNGDGDGLIDAGETIELSLRLINYGQAAARHVTAVLRSADPEAIIGDSLQTFPDIAPGDTALCDEPYLLTMAPDAEDGHTIYIEIETKTSGTFCSGTDFQIEIVAPVIICKDHTVADVQGDGDGRAESGERSELVLDLENLGQGQATGLWARLSTDDEYLTITDDTSEFPDVNPQALASNRSDPFVFTVRDGTPHHHALFTLSIFSNDDHYTVTRLFEVIIERADILLVDDDGGDTLESFFNETLAAQSWSSDYLDRVRDGGLDTFMVDEYKSIIWFTGNQRDSTLTPEDQGRLRTFLGRGGHLFLTGQDIGYDLVATGSAEDQAFYRDYLHADLIRDVAGADILMGVPGEPLIVGVSQANILGIVYGGAGNQASPSAISPRDGASALYTYSGTNDAAGIKYANGYKLVYFAVGFEGIGTFIGQDHAGTRVRLMKNITDWFQFGSDKGDVNGDNLINILDVISTVHILLGTTAPTPAESWAADYNSDGQITVVDIVGIVNEILKGAAAR